MMKAGASDSDVMQLGGWTSPDVIRRYGSIRAQERGLAVYDDVAPFGSL